MAMQARQSPTFQKREKQVLKVLHRYNKPLCRNTLHRVTGIPKTTLFRILTNLKQQGKIIVFEKSFREGPGRRRTLYHLDLLEEWISVNGLSN